MSVASQENWIGGFHNGNEKKLTGLRNRPYVSIVFRIHEPSSTFSARNSSARLASRHSGCLQ
jgi:hypothetical protein